MSIPITFPPGLKRRAISKARPAAAASFKADIPLRMLARFGRVSDEGCITRDKIRRRSLPSTLPRMMECDSCTIKSSRLEELAGPLCKSRRVSA
jgi:hypothetical protein